MHSARFASGLSTLPDTSAALDEAAAALTAGLGGRRPDLLLAFLTLHHGGEFEGLPGRIQAATGAELVLGCTGESIVGGSREVEGEPALALWAVSCPDLQVATLPVRARLDEGGEVRFSGLPPVSEPSEATLLLLADPFSFPMPAYLELLGRERPGVPAVGGMASGGRGPGQHFLIHGDELLTEGAVVAVLEGGIELHPVVSQGCRPVGRPMVITKKRDNLIQTLGGKPAAQVLAGVLGELPTEDRELFQRAPFLGIAVDAVKSSFERGDFLVRGIMGIQQSDGALAVADAGLRAGQTVQLMVRDSASAGEDLSQLMRAESAGLGGGAGVGALLFTCNGRGQRMFQGQQNPDIGRVQGAFPAEIPAAGFFAMGEIGPVGGQNFLHGFTASVALFRGRDD
jgi:small ligand-binding sensory domain FIST